MEDQFVTIAINTFSMAQIIKGHLEAEGIECYLKDINIIHSAVPGGVKIRVSSKKLEKALRIVEKVNEKIQEENNELNEKDYNKNVQKILVPVDFSDYSINACKYAIGLAEKLNAEIKLLHVYYNPVVNSMPLTDTYYYQVNMDEIIREIELRAKKNMERFYNDIKEKLETDGIQDVKIDYELIRGIVADEIIEVSKRYKPEVIIIGTRGSGEKENDLIGSVTVKIIENTKVPVLAIPEDSIYLGINTINIMYTTNFDDSDLKSLKKLMNILSPFDIRLYCVHIGTKETITWDKVKMDNLKDNLKKLYQDYEIECVIIEGEDFLAEIQEIIRAKKIDILSMVTHKRNILAKLFNPSIAKKVLFHSNIPLFVFHSSK
ncbi:MAG: universal stress protein [Bacteroidales bacterium]|jgi:nucleotide-binding universal stress UspA family protein|nr:universal stress protein [Bacteroidales bacterium]